MPKQEKKPKKTIVAVLRKYGKFTIAEPCNNIMAIFGKTRVIGAEKENVDFTPFPPVLIPKDKRGAAKSGQLVEVLIDKSPNERAGSQKQAKGRVVRVLGKRGDVKAEMQGIIVASGIPFVFDEKIKDESELVNQSVTEAETAHRADYRDILTVTVDGEDTKDFDDAVSIKRDGENYILGVHIADVTHYVAEKSHTDKEALERGNSVYLPGRVIPMLPFALSNAICSLIAGKDRLCLSVSMKIDKTGKVLSHEIAESVINIRKRLTYTQVAAIIGDTYDGCDVEAEIRGALFVMAELAEVLAEKRRADGALDFDIEESKVILDESGSVREIAVTERNVATKIIEEFMVLTNQTVAERFFWNETPFVYRSHDTPDSEKIAELADFLRTTDISFEIKKLVRGGKNALSHSSELQKILDAASDESFGNAAERRIIKRGILRTMKQAHYSAVETSHFGLSIKYYCHFTSPIRRYADLQIHRIIKESLTSSGIAEKRLERLFKRAERVASHASKTERIAEKLEREAAKLYKCEYMLDKVGCEFDAVISHVAKHGIYVELPNMVEGMVALYTLDRDYYVFDETNMRFVGERTREVFRIGDSVRVRLTDVSIADRYIDFVII